VGTIISLIFQIYVKHNVVLYGDNNELNNANTTGSIWLRIGKGGGHY
jgi:hypothetical protein